MADVEPLALLQIWCGEAVREFGDDWPRIHGHIRKKFAELPEAERKMLLHKVLLVLAPMDCEPH